MGISTSFLTGAFPDILGSRNLETFLGASPHSPISAIIYLSLLYFWICLLFLSSQARRHWGHCTFNNSPKLDKEVLHRTLHSTFQLFFCSLQSNPKKYHNIDRWNADILILLSDKLYTFFSLSMSGVINLCLYRWRPFRE